ncbi:MAG: NAD(P)-binding domain-containing protein, partial [Pseudomonadota bacterium]
MSKRIAFIGLGNMGGPMAENLAKAGHIVTAFDLNEAAVSAAQQAGCNVADSAVEVVDGADVIITMLPAGQHVVAVYEDIAEKIAGGALMIDCSTIDIDSAKRAHEIAGERGALSVDAPVSGG